MRILQCAIYKYIRTECHSVPSQNESNELLTESYAIPRRMIFFAHYCIRSGILRLLRASAIMQYVVSELDHNRLHGQFFGFS